MKLGEQLQASPFIEMSNEDLQNRMDNLLTTINSDQLQYFKRTTEKLEKNTIMDILEATLKITKLDSMGFKIYNPQQKQIFTNQQDSTQIVEVYCILYRDQKYYGKETSFLVLFDPSSFADPKLIAAKVIRNVSEDEFLLLRGTTNRLYSSCPSKTAFD